jgi:hypothetical protein
MSEYDVTTNTEAAETALPDFNGAAYSYCSMPEVSERALSSDLGPDRLQLIIDYQKKWVNGTVLRYYFFDQDSDGSIVNLPDATSEWRSWIGAKHQKEVVRRAFEIWKETGIGLEFKEVNSRHEAEVRIGFLQDGRSWSYVGRDILHRDLGVNDRTMNFGWSLTQSPQGIDTALHEIGHTLGFPHEHQNPFAGIVWDEEAVYAALARPPNRWPRNTTFYNIIRKITPDEVQGSNWDPDSVMHYPFQPGMIKEPQDYRNGIQPAGGLSARDIAWVKNFYPPLAAEYPELKPLEVARLAIRPGEQKNFVIRPTATRNYTMQTFGESDTVMVLFEDIDGDLRYVTADDDSGEDYNAKIQVKLFSGRNYVLRVRLYYSGGSGETGVMLWSG